MKQCHILLTATLIAVCVSAACAGENSAPAPKSVRTPTGVTKVDSDGASRLSVRIPQGEICVVAATTGAIEFRVQAGSSALDTAATQAFLREMKIERRRTGEGDNIIVTWPEPEVPQLQTFDPHIRLALPRTLRLDLYCVHGQVEANGVAEARIRVDRGGIRARNITRLLDAHVGFGNIIVDRCTGRVETTVDSGRILTLVR